MSFVIKEKKADIGYRIGHKEDIIWVISDGQYVINDYQTKFIKECIYRQFISERKQYIKYVAYEVCCVSKIPSRIGSGLLIKLRTQ